MCRITPATRDVAPWPRDDKRVGRLKPATDIGGETISGKKHLRRSPLLAPAPLGRGGEVSAAPHGAEMSSGMPAAR
eukprot:CAMPEP_0170205768 /NCGR_PEP_ID=MMETSP0116_2-20130129/2429_1 /TAXON_ID=400756 /ORGANISM="Durinskia baltica, Strain CSIRO CS-38" /LENGTH=75 /DNA_ID=CAMNT_0010456161 /DNA_START=78 /DNA_END=301 /DNA_ORIENTATION=-